MDYEIRKLKKKITEDKKFGLRAQNKLKEQKNYFGEVLQESVIYKDNESPYTQALMEAIVLINRFDELTQSIELLLNLPSFREEDLF